MNSTPSIVRAKVVMAGEPGVGKTSLTRRFVSNEFSEHHIESIGVRIEKRTVELPGYQVELMVWDVAGVEDDAPLHAAYLNGAMGVLYVADHTRADSVSRLVEIEAQCQQLAPDHMQVALLNKNDLPHDGVALDAFQGLGITHKNITSALTGSGVEDAFTVLAEEAVSRSQ